MSKKIIVYSISILLFLVISLVILKIVPNHNSEEKSINQSSVKQIVSNLDEEKKMREFILKNLPNPNIDQEFMIELDQRQMNPKTFPFEILLTGLNRNDMDMFLSAFNTASLNETFPTYASPEERINLIAEYMNNLKKNGTLRNLSYQFDLGTYNEEKDTGLLIFEYEGHKKVEVPFKLEKTEEENVDYSYRIATSLKTIVDRVNQLDAK